MLDRQAERTYRANEWLWWRASVAEFRREHAASLERQRAAQQAADLDKIIALLASAMAPYVTHMWDRKRSKLMRHMYDTGAIRGHTRPEVTLYECDTG